ncbi:PREDICTED: LOC18777395 [Prunus dulcis]|uniref:PREDICTED: LOC18777395 n=1 Tax=Prunus dulcis TaxID=3755 RepID=A0A5E4FPP2_PRUDU|nr:PREDICTED: LOC18777395 [Prunus dulcis]
MVEDIKQKQGEGLGKLKNCLVVGNSEVNYSDEMFSEAGLELLVSEVSEEPWKRKMIKYSGGKYQLDLIQDHDLKSKLEFIKRRYTNTKQHEIWLVGIHKLRHSGGV